MMWRLIWLSGGFQQGLGALVLLYAIAASAWNIVGGYTGMMRRLIWLSVGLAILIAYPLLMSTPFQQRLGALVLLYAIAASAWNIVGGYAGQVSVGHVVFFGCGAYAAMGAYAHFELSPLVGIPAGIVIAVAIAAVIGGPTLRLSGH